MDEEIPNALPVSRTSRSRPQEGRKPAAEPSLMARALRSLSRREYSREELRKKLSSYAPDGAALDALLTQLEQKGFLSDTRAAASLVRQKAGRTGQARLRQEMLARGFSPDMVRETLAPLQDSELERAQQVWQAKFGRQALPQPAEREMLLKHQAKQMRFLLTRGFAADVARKVVMQQGRE